ncbi:hypothetical protein KW805_00815 [Candidatus Pacearchaeota archaeon]|nr:hypothetical protein [Candidatus Pacearchaeota archaeon]
MALPSHSIFRYGILFLNTNADMIIGVTGYIRAGKTECGNYLSQTFGFYRDSFGAVVREEAQEQNITPTRENLQRLGYEFPLLKGNPGIWAERISERLQGMGYAVIEGIRNPVDIDVLQKLHGFRLLGVVASFERRYQRHLHAEHLIDSPFQRKRFEEIDKRDQGRDTHGYGQSSSLCLHAANIILQNDKGLPHFYDSIGDALGMFLNL